MEQGEHDLHGMYRYRLMNIKSFVSQHKRGLTQFAAAVLYNCHLAGFITGRIDKGATKGICVPGLNCYSCPGAVFACPLGSLQGALNRSAVKFPIYVSGMLLLFGALCGRVICGFFCPFGLLQELLYKLPLPKLKKSRITRALSCVKYVILVIFVVAIPVIVHAPGFCKYICPAGTLEAGIPLVFADAHLQTQLGWLFSWKLLLLLFCAALCAVCYRAFCRFVCPLGAIYSFFHPVSIYGIRVDEKRCIGCNACVAGCKMDIAHVGDRECIHCGECAPRCPKDAINESPFNLKI